MNRFLDTVLLRRCDEQVSRSGRDLDIEPPPEPSPPRQRRIAGSAWAELGPKARELRAQGLEWPVIGQRLGVSGSYAARLAKGTK